LGAVLGAIRFSLNGAPEFAVCVGDASAAPIACNRNRFAIANAIAPPEPPWRSLGRSCPRGGPLQMATRDSR
jgi:hypothetical protein